MTAGGRAGSAPARPDIEFPVSNDEEVIPHETGSSQDRCALSRVSLRGRRRPCAPAAQTMSIEEYEPKSTLVVPEHHPAHAKYPFIDVHNHQDTDISAADAAQLVADMDRLNMKVMVNLSGDQGAEFEKGYRESAGPVPGPLRRSSPTSTSRRSAAPAGPSARSRSSARTYKHGARGLKIFKNLGMSVERHGRQARRRRRSAPRSDLGQVRRARHPGAHPHRRAALLLRSAGQVQRALAGAEAVSAARAAAGQVPAVRADHDGAAPHVRASIRRRRFIDAHLGWLGDDLARLGKLFDEMPNVYTEIGAVLAELGRQPRAAREWFLKYQDRVLFGKDIWAPDEYHIYFRVLETDGRVLRLLPQAPRLLEDVRPRSARRGAARSSITRTPCA